MPQPSGLRKIFALEKQNALPQKKLTKSLSTVIAVCQLIFGYNFGFAKLTTGKFKTVINMITMLSANLSVITQAFIMIYLPGGLVQYGMIVHFVKYVITLFMLFSVKYSLCEFLADLVATFQRPLDEKCIFICLYSYMSWTCVVNVASLIMYNLRVHNESCSGYIIVMIHTFMFLHAFGNEVIPVANYLLFYHVYARMRNLKKEFKRREINLEQFLTSYKAVADSFERFRKGYDGIFVCGFVADSPRWIINILTYLTYMKSSTSSLQLACSYAWAFQATKQICVPAVFAEMINVQTDAMKIILHERLMVETDKTQALKTGRVLEYIKARPLLRNAWRLVPLDLQLPVIMLSMCATYLIVIIQFIHLYD